MRRGSPSAQEAAMNHHDIDASLRAAEPAQESLADGFSPPSDESSPADGDPGEKAAAEAALSAKSPF